MKVRRIVELLYQTYDPEQEIMAMWWGSEFYETTAGAWDRAVEIFDRERRPQEINDYVRDLILDAEALIEQEEAERLHAELAMDSYLERVREEQADV